ncbi:uncharacterized protein F5147DRAFT_820735 [Suillus discolor]|uniref:Protein-S-isoprenylcysteine O-methyltransferase n=1 Tax=Suillus discolor TaxID=1912936 RepID=A0A9P7EWC1_9AGAM|nr:uncharacterized protein F5147DRAFT_820735 [Suillus discolor]KAG2094021.1 hypothetical protein F5147DRAFT_820735 [Suillus discolor]
MSLLKIPFILVSAIGIHISLTSPSPSPSSKECVVPSVFEFITEWGIKLGCAGLMKTNTWVISLVEVANILATRLGPSDIPEGISGTRAMQLLRVPHPTPITPAFLVGSIAIALGGALRLYCMSTLGKFWSFNLSVRKEHRLVTSGPYSVVRHPSYTGLLLQSAGMAVAYGSQGSWMRQSGIFRPALEDQMLQRALGEEWENWAKEVRYRLVPGIY